MRPLAAIQMSVVTALAGAAALLGAAWLRDAPAPIAPPAVAPVAVTVDAVRDVTTTEPAPVPIEPPEQVRCCACAMEDNRRNAREQQQVFEARFLGVEARHDRDGKRTNRRCTADHKIWASVRFEVTRSYPWITQPDRASRMLMSLPCPELSRAEYRRLYGIDGDWRDDEDGLGTAPKLKHGATYTLRVVTHDRTLLAIDGPQR